MQARTCDCERCRPGTVLSQAMWNRPVDHLTWHQVHSRAGLCLPRLPAHPHCKASFPFLISTSQHKNTALMPSVSSEQQEDAPS